MTVIGILLLAAGIVIVLTAGPAMAMEEEIIGAVVKTDQGAALSTEAGEYLILGKNLDKLIGKTVAVTGQVEEGADTQTIRADSVRILVDKDIVDPPDVQSGN
jgi:hypothetical protein